MSDAHFALVKAGAVKVALWRKQHPGVTLDLEGAEFTKSHFPNGLQPEHDGASDTYVDMNLSGAKLSRCRIEIDIRGADFSGAMMDRAVIRDAIIKDGNFNGANLNRARIVQSTFASSNLSRARLQRAIFRSCVLPSIQMNATDLRGTEFHNCDLSFGHIESTVTNDVTLFSECKLDGTWFRGTLIRHARVFPESDREVIAYFRRRNEWQEWYDRRSAMKLHLFQRAWKGLGTNAARLFWWLSDYGRSTMRLVGATLILLCTFGVLYGIPWGNEKELILKMATNDNRGLPRNVPSNDAPQHNVMDYNDHELPTHPWRLARGIYYSLLVTVAFEDPEPNPAQPVSFFIVGVHMCLSFCLVSAFGARIATILGLIE